MNRFSFFLTVEGLGDNAQEAWYDAMERLMEAMHKGEYSKAPERIFGPDDPISGADILGGSLSEFGIDHGPDEMEGGDG